MSWKGRHWTADEEERLRKAYPHLESSLIAEAMHRSVSSVESRAFRLGVKKIKPKGKHE